MTWPEAFALVGSVACGGFTLLGVLLLSAVMDRAGGVPRRRGRSRDTQGAPVMYAYDKKVTRKGPDYKL